MAEISRPNFPALRDFRAPRITRRYLAKLLAACTASLIIVGYLGTRYDLGIDSQFYRCMEAKYFVIDTWFTPDASRIRPGRDVLAFTIGEAQAIPGLGWDVGDTMVKYVMATQPGTIIDVTLDGVHFTEPSGLTWSYGKGLEGAYTIEGAEPEDFVRTLTLGVGEFWAMGEMPYSIDSRYYGVVYDSQISGRSSARW